MFIWVLLLVEVVIWAGSKKRSLLPVLLAKCSIAICSLQPAGRSLPSTFQSSANNGIFGCAFSWIAGSISPVDPWTMTYGPSHLQIEHPRSAHVAVADSI